MSRPKLRVVPKWVFSVTRLAAGFWPSAVTKPPFGISFSRDWWEGASVGRRLRTLRHEMAHWRQYERMGFFKFVVMYAYYHIRYDYKNNPMEIEARAAE